MFQSSESSTWRSRLHQDVLSGVSSAAHIATREAGAFGSSERGEGAFPR